jgi:very-short-patch-repair endonuclease
MELKLNLVSAASYTLAADQNAYPLFRNLSLEAVQVDETEGVPKSRAKSIAIKLISDPEFFEPHSWQLDELSSGQSVQLQKIPLKIYHQKLAELTEEIPVTFYFTVNYEVDGETREIVHNINVSFLPKDYWGGERRQQDLLAAFVQPNTPAVEALCSQAGKLLRAEGKGSQLDGYQSNTRDRPYLMASALWTTIFNEGITYINPPPDWALNGQRIRFPEKILKYRAAACLDTSVMFASCLEAMGLNPIIALTKTHAFAGVWLIDERFPVLTNDDAMDLRKCIAMSDLVVFETTLVTNDHPVTFKQAVDHANELLREENEQNFVMMIDVKSARARQIKPIALFDESDAKEVDKTANQTTLSLGLVPPLPPVKLEELHQEETPDTRVDLWRRKLLDLTKRNPLLSAGSTGLSIYCPNLPMLEDKLASGLEFSFLAATESPHNESDRDADQFRLATGNTLHEQYALEQLDRRVLIANENKPRLETKLVELYRKAKNDMLEGGTNTLYLAIGMLKWTDTPKSGKYYRAPLVLVPVSLHRSSARASVRLKQLPEEDPIFNLTLIEMLRVDYEIKLETLKGELPKDESGVNIRQVWDIVRHAIRHTEGFEVTEELVLATFSFAKYLMWKDLTERMHLLKENPFVNHLVERPQETYAQTAKLMEPAEIDRKIKPREFYAPLNCDSSQIVAIEASGKPQDFVLEGPPGTGKSETIANIICHNIALGRKILFVSEKMEALNVVYRRIENIGLDHLCLELHSSKASKKEVISQLHRAWTQREKATPEQWHERADRLELLREELNQYVFELHKPRTLGVSARDAIARTVRYGDLHNLRLDWEFDLSNLPFQSRQQFDALLDAVREIELAYKETEGIDGEKFKFIARTTFSNQWSTELVRIAQKLHSQIKTLETKSSEILSSLGLPSNKISIGTILFIERLVPLVEHQSEGNLRFGIEPGAKDRIKKLIEICEIRVKLDDLIGKLGHGFTFDSLEKSPLESWISIRNQNSGVLGVFKRRVIHKQMKDLGLDKMKDLTQLDLALDAHSTLRDLRSSLNELSLLPSVNVLVASAQQIEQQLDGINRIYKAFSSALVQFDDPVSVGNSIRAKLYEMASLGIDKSPSAHKIDQILPELNNLRQTLEDLARCEFAVDQACAVEETLSTLQTVVEKSSGLPRWCRWLAVKQNAKENHLSSVVAAIETAALEPSQSCEAFITAINVWLAPRLIDSSAILSQFSRSTHEDKISTFRALDAEVAKTTAQYISARVAGLRRDQSDSSIASAQIGVLSREAQKKTRHMPVRQLISEMRDVLFDLTPCLMMSPLSVAQFLPADLRSFDLVVFDEASQITTWDAVGAVARGRNVIIVGDPKQMPPSNHFGRATDGSDADLESILDQALAAALPHLRLTGHYRSRHETLIAFSNAQYYENSLVTYPSAETKQSAVRLCRVDGVYAKGTQRTNPKEAKAVVDELVRLLTGMIGGMVRHSIGIVTINAEQERLVNDLIDDARRNKPELEPFFQRHDGYEEVFVKNLESVQGDQRDIIMLSITYGPTEPGSKSMSMNFGPLNREGGERRLNVAITRATTEVIVFSSFDSTMIDLTRTNSTAVQHLKNYLEFAERGPIALGQFNRVNQASDQFDSDFELAVATRLRSAGWIVQTQVGVSRFRVDLGIVHPDEPGRFIAGIECDGATYHSSPSARDRDRVRQVILEGLGWNIIRIWSTDFFQDASFAMQRVSEKLEQLLSEDRIQSKENSPQQTAEGDDSDPKHTETHSTVEPDGRSGNFDAENDDHIEQEPEYDTPKLKYASAKTAPADNPQFPTLDDSAGDLDSDEGLDTSGPNELPKEKFFDADQRDQINTLARDILTKKTGITLHELASEIAASYGLARTSSKQQEHVLKIIAKWAGIKRNSKSISPTVWLSASDVKAVIPWRGVAPFGEYRFWKDLPEEERIGLALKALALQPDDPVGWMFTELEIGRQRTSTIEEFKRWVTKAKALNTAQI